MPSMAALAVLAFPLAGCFQQPMPDLSDLPEAPAAFPNAKYQQLIADGWTVYQIDPAQTLLQVRVYKEGKLARLGHNHIVSTNQIQGRIAAKGELVAANLFIRVDQLEVDRADLRAAAGEDFASAPDSEDIAGTRANMLSDKVLDALAHPFVELKVSQLMQTIGGTQLVAELTLHGVTGRHLIPALVEQTDQRLQVQGQWVLDQSAFSIPRFSVLGGALGVSDRIGISFALVADVNSSG